MYKETCWFMGPFLQTSNPILRVSMNFPNSTLFVCTFFQEVANHLKTVVLMRGIGKSLTALCST